MSTEYIRDIDQKIIGSIDTKSNGDRTARMFPSQKIIGFYFKDQNVTTNLIYTRLTFGDSLVSLIMAEHAKGSK